MVSGKYLGASVDSAKLQNSSAVTKNLVQEVPTRYYPAITQYPFLFHYSFDAKMLYLKSTYCSGTVALGNERRFIFRLLPLLFLIVNNLLSFHRSVLCNLRQMDDDLQLFYCLFCCFSFLVTDMIDTILNNVQRPIPWFLPSNNSPNVSAALCCNSFLNLFLRGVEFLVFSFYITLIFWFLRVIWIPEINFKIFFAYLFVLFYRFLLTVTCSSRNPIRPLFIINTMLKGMNLKLTIWFKKLNNFWFINRNFFRDQHLEQTYNLFHIHVDLGHLSPQYDLILRSAEFRWCTSFGVNSQVLTLPETSRLILTLRCTTTANSTHENKTRTTRILPKFKKHLRERINWLCRISPTLFSKMIFLRSMKYLTAPRCEFT